MTYRWLTDLDAALTAAGIPYTEVGPTSIDPTGASSWRTRGRPASTGQWDPHGVLCHHTASPAGTSAQSDLNVILAGNSEAPGPIAQLFVDRDATLFLVAAGRANHGGKGRRPGIDTGGCADMNAALIGIEVGNNGVGERWPDPQTDRYGAVVAALCAHYGWSVHDDVYLHATTGPPSGGCNYKIDPAGPWQGQPDLTSQTWDLATWRAFCAASSTPAPTPIPPPQEDTMPQYINKGTYATFAMTGGMCHWVPSGADADALGVPPPDANGFRGTWVSDAFLRNLILVGAFPDPAQGLWAGHFAAWWPDGTPASAVVASPAPPEAVAAAARPPGPG